VRRPDQGLPGRTRRSHPGQRAGRPAGYRARRHSSFNPAAGSFRLHRPGCLRHVCVPALNAFRRRCPLSPRSRRCRSTAGSGRAHEVRCQPPMPFAGPWRPLAAIPKNLPLHEPDLAARCVSSGLAPELKGPAPQRLRATGPADDGTSHRARPGPGTGSRRTCRVVAAAPQGVPASAENTETSRNRLAALTVRSTAGQVPPAAPVHAGTPLGCRPDGTLHKKARKLCR
jgi:hypothetical protein